MLTLGPNVIVNQAVNETSGYAELISAGSNHTGDGIVNQGTINAQAANGSFYIEPYNFTNQGTINVSNGDKLYIEPTTFTNNGAIAISEGTVDITTSVAGTGNFTINAGTLELAASSAETVTFTGPTGTLQLQHSLTAPLTGDISGLGSSPTDVIDLADLGYTNEQPTYNATTHVLTVTENGGSVNLQLINYTGSGIFTASSDGNSGTKVVVSANQGTPTTINSTLSNTGQTLTVGAGSAILILASGGTIVGGTIVDQGSGVEFQSGTLSGVTYDGTMDLSPNNSTVYIANGLTANNQAGAAPGTINLTGVSDSIYFEGNQTFNNATINLGSTSGYYDTIYNYDTNDTGSVLTLGPNVIVNQAVNETSGYAELISAGSNHTGDGIVNQGTINAQAVNGSFYIEPYNFTNQGTINVSNGDKLYIEPSVGLTNAATGKISISSAGSILDFGGGSGATTNAGTITMAAGTTLTLGSSTSALSNTGLISGTDDTVNIYSFGSFSNTGTFNITNSSGQSVWQLHDGAAGGVR